ncbi:MAG: PQQ-binding-like beta-propeller repeat protein [Akkermansiaceae bacterium]|nr:PQQ-binding-like beta-propeller repeat protein [Akkermansiaceae bacterium]
MNQDPATQPLSTAARPLTRALSRTTLTAAWLVAAASAQAADLLQLGERFTRNQASLETNLPDTVDAATGQGIKWTAKLGSSSYAPPVIAQGRVYVGTNNDNPHDPRQRGDRGVFRCLEESSGKFLWQLVVPKIGGDQYLDWPKVGIASPATVEGDRVYLLTNRAEVVCLDVNGMANGNDGPFTDEARHQTPVGKDLIPAGPADADILWVTDLRSVADIWPHDTSYGNPLLHGDFLYLNSNNGVDNTHRVIRKPDAPSLVVLAKQTGRLVAKDDEHIGPRIFHNTYSSPALGTVNGRSLVCFGGGDGVLYAFEALTAMPPDGSVANLKRVWKFDPDPGAPKTDVHTFSGNRKVSPSTIMTPPVFVGDRVYLTVGGDLWWGKYQAWLMCVAADQTGDVTATAGLWSYPLKHSCTTPAVAGPLTFAADTANKSLHCIETATGREFWQYPLGSEVWASPLVADGKVYLGTRRGKLFIFAASRDKKLLCETTLDSPISAAPAAANGVVYITTAETLYALAKP